MYNNIPIQNIMHDFFKNSFSQQQLAENNQIPIF